jgi:GR25 family glycosyltransferase involved in LPS biosynthesis
MSKSKISILILFIIAAYYSFVHFYDSKQATLDKIYVINLDRSTERYKAMQAKLDKMDFPVSYDRFSAIDGRKISFTNKLTGEVLSGQEILDKKIWQEIIKKGYKNTLIMEDDVKFIPFFDSILNLAMNNTPKDYELILLNYKNYGQAFSSEIENHFLRFFLTVWNYVKNPFWKKAKKNIMSVQGYILTNDGAKKLLQCDRQYAVNNFLAIDVTMQYCIEDKAIIAYASKKKFIYGDYGPDGSANISDITELNRKQN